MIYAVYDVNNRQLVYLTNDPSGLIPAPLNAVALQREDFPDPTAETWNPLTLAFEPIVKQKITQLEFLRRLTTTEFAAIKATCSQSADLDFYWAKFFAAEFVDLKDPEVITGLQMLEQVGLLSAGRAAQILAG